MTLLPTDTAHPATPFVLDNRPLAQRLQAWRDYCALVPLQAPSDNGTPAAGETLADLFFGIEGSSERPVSAQELERLFADGLPKPATAKDELLPHQALLLAFWRMLETPRALLNRLPLEHQRLYYRNLLGLSERPAQADRVVVSFEIEQDHNAVLIPAGYVLDAGLTDTGVARHYLLEESVLANHCLWSDLRWTLGGGQTTFVAYDISEGIAWPQGGLRLFSDQADQQRHLPGRVIGSPLLDLRGGLRTITVEFAEAVLATDISAYASSATGWLALSAAAADPSARTVSFTLGVDAEAIAAADSLEGFASAHPLLKLISLTQAPVPAVRSLSTQVRGLPGVFLNTGSGRASLEAPGQPFGAQAEAGASFELMAAEWCGKPGNLTVTLTPEWSGLPNVRLAKWYDGYDAAVADDGSYQVSAALLGNAPARLLTPSPLPLFKAATPRKGGSSEPLALVISVPPLPALPPSPLPRRGLARRAGVTDWPLRVRVELSSGFHYQAFAQRRSAADAASLNPPYTPNWTRLQVDYQSEARAPEQQYQLTAFGHLPEEAPVGKAAKPANLPLSTVPRLFLGFTGIQPGATLSVYWQLESPMPCAVTWYYLAADEAWKPLDAYVDDATEGLFGSGLWRAELPADAEQYATSMPAERIWIAADILPEVLSDPALKVSDYPWLIDLQSNCGLARRDMRTVGASAAFDGPLAPATIGSPLEPIVGLKKINQPWASEGGRPAQTEAEFFQETARRLGHRERGLTAGEITSMLLERFPQLQDVLPASEPVTLESGLRRLSFMVVPAHGQRDNTDPLRPAFNPARLARMADALKGHVSPWLECVLINPTYIDISVTFTLVFQPGVNTDFGYQQVREALQHRYMPWGWDIETSVAMGSSIDYYRLLAFIQAQPVVLRITALTLTPDKPSAFGEVPILVFP